MAKKKASKTMASPAKSTAKESSTYKPSGTVDYRRQEVRQTSQVPVGSGFRIKFGTLLGDRQYNKLVPKLLPLLPGNELSWRLRLLLR
ncbi:MAG: hypothetical protein ABL921_07245 [Pirellula sp.]